MAVMHDVLRRRPRRAIALVLAGGRGSRLRRRPGLTGARGRASVALVAGTAR
jgi:hypothetical protein